MIAMHLRAETPIFKFGKVHCSKINNMKKSKILKNINNINSFKDINLRNRCQEYHYHSWL